MEPVTLEYPKNGTLTSDWKKGKLRYMKKIALNYIESPITRFFFFFSKSSSSLSLFLSLSRFGRKNAHFGTGISLISLQHELILLFKREHSSHTEIFCQAIVFRNVLIMLFSFFVYVYVIFYIKEIKLVFYV